MEQQDILQDLNERAHQRYTERVGALKKHLNSLNLPNDAIEQVLYDYKEAMGGGRAYSITPTNLSLYLSKYPLQEWRKIDNIVLLGVLLWDYVKMLRALMEWENESPTDRERTKEEVQEWLDKNSSNPFALWCVRRVWDSEYKTTYNETTLLLYSRMILKRYLYTCFVARYALNATKEEVEEIPQPTDNNIIEEVWITTEQQYKDLCTTEQKLIEEANALNGQNHTAKSEMIKEQEKPYTTAEKTIKTSRLITKVQSEVPYTLQKLTDKQRQQPCWVKPMKGQPSIPVEVVSRQLMERGDIAMPCSVQMFQNALNGLNALQYLSTDAPQNGIYSYRVSVTEFAKMCFDREPSGEEAREMFTALNLLQERYWLIDGGQKAVKLCSIMEINKTNGGVELSIAVPQAVYEFNPIWAQEQSLLALRDMQKKQTTTRFTAQLLSKEHKKEEALLDAIFGYSARLKEAEDRPAYSKVKRDIQLHKSRDKSRLKGWFAQLANKGVITYERKQNKEGEWVYEWEVIQGDKLPS